MKRNTMVAQVAPGRQQAGAVNLVTSLIIDIFKSRPGYIPLNQLKPRSDQ
jgi:hypothetical protein